MESSIGSKQYIEEIIVEFNKEDPMLYAPYLAMVQSSGWGKTKLAIEVSRHFCSVFICLRDLGTTGDPRRSTIANLFLSLVTAEEYLMFYQSLFTCYYEHVVRRAEDIKAASLRFFEIQMIEEEDYIAFWSSVEKTFKGLKTSFDMEVQYFGKSALMSC